jgi:hypothetical protein
VRAPYPAQVDAHPAGLAPNFDRTHRIGPTMGYGHSSVTVGHERFRWS